MNKKADQPKRPQSERELQVVQRRAYELAKKGDYEAALALCDWLIESPLTEVAGRRQRAAVHEHQGDISQSIEDLEAVVASGVDEPADMHALGLLYLQVGRNSEAEQVLERGVQICLAQKVDYYLNSCRLLRAEGLLRLGKRAIALKELNQLPIGYSAYVFGRGNRAREVMIEEAQQG